MRSALVLPILSATLTFGALASPPSETKMSATLSFMSEDDHGSRFWLELRNDSTARVVILVDRGVVWGPSALDASIPKKRAELDFHACDDSDLIVRIEPGERVYRLVRLPLPAATARRAALTFDAVVVEEDAPCVSKGRLDVDVSLWLAPNEIHGVQPHTAAPKEGK